MQKNAFLALTAAILAVSVVFVGLPAMVFGPGQADFTSSFPNILEVYLTPAALVTAVFVIPAVILPARIGKVWACLVAVLAIYFWAHGTFQIHDFGIIDGRGWTARVPGKAALIDVVVSLLVAFIVFKFAARSPIILGVFMLVFAAPIAWQAAPLMHGYRQVSNETALNELGAFSKKKNVLVVLMDTMQSDIFEEVISKNTGLAEEFDGFTFYPDTAGSAPTTYLSIPVIHSGRTYDPKTPLAPYFRDAVENGSFMAKLGDSGYSGILVNQILDACPRTVHCVPSRSVLAGSKSSVVAEAAKLLDLAIFRIAPLGAKDAVYNNGEWIAQKHTSDDRFVHLAVEGNALLTETAGAVSDTAAKPSLKFIHLFTTHPPYVVDDKCEYLGEEQQINRTSDENQAACSVANFAKMLKAMKAKGVYDNTVIALISDHGNYLMKSNRVDEDGWQSLIGSANPTLVVKPAGAHGALQKSNVQAQIGDLGATICGMTDDCTAEFGSSVLTVKDGRTRVFNDYRWDNSFWTAETIATLKTYQITGPLFASSSWESTVSLKTGELVQFNNRDATKYMFGGWAVPEQWGTWTIEKAASLGFGIEPSAENGAVEVTLRGFVAPAIPNRAVNIYVNGALVAEQVFTLARSKETIQLPIPRSVDHVRIKFEVVDTRSPADLGLSRDDRAIGIGLERLRIVPAKFTQ